MVYVPVAQRKEEELTPRQERRQERRQQRQGGSSGYTPVSEREGFSAPTQESVSITFPEKQGFFERGRGAQERLNEMTQRTMEELGTDSALGGGIAGAFRGSRDVREASRLIEQRQNSAFELFNAIQERNKRGEDTSRAQAIYDAEMSDIKQAVDELGDSYRFGLTRDQILDQTRRVDEQIASGEITQPKTFLDVIRDTREDPTRLAPFLNQAEFVSEAQQVLRAVNDLKQGDISESDALLLRNYVLENSRGRNVGGFLGEILTQAPAFALEFAASGGIGTATRVATKKSVKEALESLTNTTLRNQLDNALIKYGVDSLSGVAGVMADAAARTATVRGGAIVGNTLQNMTADLGIAENELGELEATIADEGDDVGRAFVKGALNEYIEVGSEMVGQYLRLPAALRESAAKTAIFRAIVKRNATRPVSEVARKFGETLKNVGWNGVIEEFLEERVGDVARFGLSQVGLADYEAPSKEQILAELIGFSALGTGFSTINFALNRSQRQQVQEAVQNDNVPLPPQFVEQVTQESMTKDENDIINSIQKSTGVTVDEARQVYQQALRESIAFETTQLLPQEQTELSEAESVLEQEEGVADEALFKKQEEFDVTLKTLEELRGRETVSKQFISDLTNRGTIKQVERDIIREALEDEGDTVRVDEFIEKVQSDLLPLESFGNTKGDTIARYESVTLPSEERGDVSDYSEKIYTSPIKTSAGDVHFGESPMGDEGGVDNYFAHSRIEDMADGTTRRVIEVQSDLFQKGRMEAEQLRTVEEEVSLRERQLLNDVASGILTQKEADNIIEKTKVSQAKKISQRDKELSKLKPYRNTFWQRIIREEVKSAAQDNVETLLFPTGETAMKIEGLGSSETFATIGSNGIVERPVTIEDLEVGIEVGRVTDTRDTDNWIITEVLDDGKFKAISKNKLRELGILNTNRDVIERAIKEFRELGITFEEQFDISGKLDKSNPIYKFYEKDVGRYLKNKYDATRFEDENDISWWKVDVPESAATEPVEAFKKEEKTQTVSYKTAEETIKKYQKRLGIDFPVNVYQKIYTGSVINGTPEQAFGMYMDNTITLAETVTAFTADHEIGHFAFRNLEKIPVFKGITREQLYSELRKKYGNMSNIELEEKLMEGFEKFAKEQQDKKPTTFAGKIKEFYQKLYKTLKDLLNISNTEYKSIQRFYDQLYFGKNKDVVTFQSTGKSSSFMERRFKEFGEEPVMFKRVIENEQEAKKEAEYQTIVELEIAEQGERIRDPETMEWSRIPSTYPQWIPKDSRTRKTIDKAIEYYEKGERPPKRFNRVLEAYDEIVKTIYKRTRELMGGVEPSLGAAEQEYMQILTNEDIQREKVLLENTEEKQFQASKQRQYDNKLAMLYTKNVLDALSKNIPRSEWSRYMNRLVNIGTSETKLNNLLNAIYDRSSQIEVERGERSEKAKVRSSIGYLRKIYDLSPSLILSIKQDLNIRDTYKRGERAGQPKNTLKSIKDMTLEELLMFKEEVNKRIKFRKDNPVNHFALVKEEKGVIKKAVDVVKAVDRNFIGTSERVLQRISKPLYESVMTVFFEEKKLVQKRMEGYKPLRDIYEKATSEDRELIKQYGQSAKESQMRSVLEQYATPEEVDIAIKKAREVLDGIYSDLKDVGIEVPYRQFFFPRKLKPMDRATAETLIKTFEYKQGKEASLEEKTKIVNNLMRGFDVARLPFITLSGKRFEAHRLIETITPDVSQFYENFDDAMISYIVSATAVAEQRRFFGKFVIDTMDYQASLENSIGAKVWGLVESGVLKKDEVKKVEEVLKTVFSSRVGETERAIQQFTNDFVYPLALWQVTSAIRQMRDLSLQVLVNDIFPGQINTIGGVKIKPEDVYLSESITDLETGLSIEEEMKWGNKFVKKFANVVNKTLVPFQKTDEAFLTVFINGSYRRAVKMAKSNSKVFRKSMEDIFGKEKANEVISDLQTKTGKEKNIPDEVSRWIFSEVARLRPITKLQKTQTSVRHPMYYTLKNFMFKQLQFTRAEALDIINDGIKAKDPKMIANGVGRLVALMSSIGLLGAGVEELIDFIMGRKDGNFLDKIFESLLQIVGFNYYLMNLSKRQGTGTTLLHSYVIPADFSIPIQVFDEGIKDVRKLIEGEPFKDLRTLRRAPFGGNIYYYRLGGGSD